ncbi:MAG: DUF4177 domain-containing protein [Lachnospiraceae bacterium]|nr:DUF4177 domain-containing protein [Lachnospiraceae bacterium]
MNGDKKHIEYKVEIIKQNETEYQFATIMEDKLNNMAKEGWEVVSILNNYSIGKGRYSLVGLCQDFICVMKKGNTTS